MNNEISVWSEFTPYSDLIPKLQELKSCGVALNLAIHESTIEQAELYELLKRAHVLGVEIRPWLLLEKSKGYWPNHWNLPEFREFTSRFLESCETHGVKIEWIIVDMEPHITLLLELEELLKKKHFLRARKLISEWGKKKTYDWKPLIQEMQKRKVKVQVVVMPMVLDDKQKKLQRHLGIPIEGLPWDEVSFMIYRPYFWDYLPGMSAGIVRSYARDAYKQFGEKASVALGPIGSPMVTKSQNFYRDPSQMVEDKFAAHLEKITRFSLFSLEGIEEQGKLKEFVDAKCSKSSCGISVVTRIFRKVISIGISFLK